MNIAYRSKAYVLKTQILDKKDNDSFQRTVELLKSSIRVYTHDKWALVQLGHLLSLKNQEQAEKYFKKVEEIDPNFYQENVVKKRVKNKATNFLDSFSIEQSAIYPNKFN